MDIFKKPYELSLWEDVLTFIYEDEFESEGEIINDHGKVVTQYYQERKICIIGSNTMDTPIRAINGKLNQKISGENVLTFELYSHYYDEDSEELLPNPYTGLIFNERKVKLRTGSDGSAETKWYDLVIKDIQKDSERKVYTYTAKDLFINELSKSGFNLEFNIELGNNTKTLGEFAEEVLSESDWKLESSIIQPKEYIEEPVYLIHLNSDIAAVDMLNKSEDGTNITINIGADKYIYAFYDDIINQRSDVQFLYIEGKKYDQYDVDDNSVIIGSKNYLISGVTYQEGLNSPNFATSMTISPKYRGKRLVRKQEAEYDNTVDKYVKVYKDASNNRVYGYTESEYVSPVSVRSYITNAKDYDSTNGWEVGGVSVEVEGEASEVVFPRLSLTTVPHIKDLESNQTLKSYLKLENLLRGQCLRNSGLVDNRSFIKGFTQGERYIFKITYGEAGQAGSSGPKTLVESSVGLQITIGKTTLENGIYTIKDDEERSDVIFRGEIAPGETLTKTITLICLKSLSYEEILSYGSNLSILIEIAPPAENSPIGDTNSTQKTLYIEDVQLFPEVIQNNDFLNPGEVAGGEVRTLYCYYTPNPAYQSADDIVFLYKDYIDSSNYTPIYDESYEKKRTLTASESNRFNLLQDLAELFECWVKFRIDHETDGSIVLDENKRQSKWVSFYESIERNNYTGFKYGINLKSIKRNIESEGFVSKLIVKNNSNEYARDGFCSIARASENPSGENFILDFNYYIQHGMLGLSEITNDLYLDVNGYIGYYKKLRELNNLRDQYIEEQSGLLATIPEYESILQVYTLAAEEAQRLQRDKRVFVESLTGFTIEFLNANKNISEDDDSATEEKLMAHLWWENEELIAAMASIVRLQQVIETNEILRDRAQENLNNAQERYDELTRILTSTEEDSTQEEQRLLLEKRELHAKFYKKYSRFLQEGSWISEDYIDDQLYYLDAQNTIRAASKPKVSYDISVLEISALEGYENFTFALGDKTTIEDTEFFGWKEDINGVLTPYAEEIIVTELTTVLDSPEENQIKVQNYKTQFEDLFQRIAAVTQSVEYATGRYNMVSNAFETDGTIGVVSLQDAIANNALILSNARDQSIVWDETGITATSLSNPAELLRIVNGGIFLSIDGGITWETGITGRGINATQITTGQLNTGVINILNGNYPSFRWDSNGLSAYKFDLSPISGQPQSFNFSKFIRFDQYGIYGIDGIANFNPNVETDDKKGEDKIWANANFALTWKGFLLKSSEDSGYISISSDNHFQIFSEGTERVHIGKLDNDVYGFQLKNGSDEVVMTHDSNGNIWIKNILSIGDESINVRIGYLPKDLINEPNGAEVEFVVLEENDQGKLEEKTVIAIATGIKGEVEYNGAIYTDVYFGWDGKYRSDNDKTSCGNQIINANDKFIVFEDGSVRARNGEFTGKIHAAGGSTFDGQIEANGAIIHGVTLTDVIIAKNGGRIGGFEIGENSLKALLKDGDGKPEIDENTGEAYSTIELDGSKGMIYVGESRNSKNQIVIDGPNGIIRSRTYDGGINGWSISHNEAIFNNIVARGTLQASVFEYGRVQAVGGILLVRPSTRIVKLISTSGNAQQVEVEESLGFNIGDYCMVEVKGEGEAPSTDRKYFEIQEVSDNKITMISKENGLLEETDLPCLIIDYGKSPDDDKKSHGSIGIGINGSNNSATVPQNSISVFELNKDKQLDFHVVLGLLNKDILESFNSTLESSYGLYADNVFLRGSLVTENKKDGNNQPIYSGVGTVFGADPPYSSEDYFGDKKGRILIWAGAKDTTRTGIENAKFYVDECGNVFGDSVHLKGALLSESVIEAAEIKTATITGYNISTNSEAALTIKDAVNGISFKNGNSSVFALGSEEVFSSLPIRLKQSKSSTQYLELKEGVEEDWDIGLWHDGMRKSNIQFVNSDIIIKSNGKTSIEGVFELKDIMRYEPYKENGTLKGYDLYVGGGV